MSKSKIAYLKEEIARLEESLSQLPLSRDTVLERRRLMDQLNNCHRQLWVNRCGRCFLGLIGAAIVGGVIATARGK